MQVAAWGFLHQLMGPGYKLLVESPYRLALLCWGAASNANQPTSRDEPIYLQVGRWAYLSEPIYVQVAFGTRGEPIF